MTAITLTRTKRVRSETTLGRILIVLRVLLPQVGVLLKKLRTVLLTVGAAGCFVTAAWMVTPILGLAVAGASLLFLEYFSAGDEK